MGRFTTSGSSPQTYYTAYTSPDGSTWTAVPGSTMVLAMSGALQAGFALTSHAQGAGGNVTLDSVAVTPGELPPPGLACPSGWTCGDIGAASPDRIPEPQRRDLDDAGGRGRHLRDRRRLPLRLAEPGRGRESGHPGGLGELPQRLGQGRAHASGHAPTPARPYYAVFATTGNGVAVQWRSTAGGSTGQLTVAGTAPVYLRVSRTGTTFAAATSPDGVTWTTVPGSAMTLGNLSGALLRGVAFTSHSNGKAGTVVFDSVVSSP